MHLTDTAIRKIKIREKPVKMFDERGLFLLVGPAGGKWWRFKLAIPRSLLRGLPFENVRWIFR